MVSTQDMLLKKYTYKQKHIHTVSNTFYSVFILALNVLLYAAT